MRTLPGGPAAQNLDRLVPWLEQDRLHAGYTLSAPQTRARRNVVRGVEVQRGTPPAATSPRGAARPGARMNRFSVISSHSVMTRFSSQIDQSVSSQNRDHISD